MNTTLKLRLKLFILTYKDMENKVWTLNKKVTSKELIIMLDYAARVALVF